jgi:hypothetical protein
MPLQIAIVVVVVVLVVVVGAYALGTYLRRRQDDLPVIPPIRPSQSSQPSSSSRPTARKPTVGAAVEISDRRMRVVVNWLLTQAFEQTGIRVADDKLAYDRIVSAAQRALDDLKQEQAVDISLPFLTADASGPKHLEARLTREMMEELVKY